MFKVKAQKGRKNVREESSETIRKEASWWHQEDGDEKASMMETMKKACCSDKYVLMVELDVTHWFINDVWRKTGVTG